MTRRKQNKGRKSTGESTAARVTVDKSASTPKKTAKAASAAKPKKPKAPKTHPPVSEMVVAAVKTLKERGGSSLQAIKKYMSTVYKVDAKKLSPFIKKFLKFAVAKGKLLQIENEGASGSFKLKSYKLPEPAMTEAVLE